MHHVSIASAEIRKVLKLDWDIDAGLQDQVIKQGPPWSLGQLSLCHRAQQTRIHGSFFVILQQRVVKRDEAGAFGDPVPGYCAITSWYSGFQTCMVTILAKLFCLKSGTLPITKFYMQAPKTDPFSATLCTKIFNSGLLTGYCLKPIIMAINNILSGS